MDLVDGSYCKISMQHLLEPDWAAVSALANRVTVAGRTLPYKQEDRDSARGERSIPL